MSIRGATGATIVNVGKWPDYTVFESGKDKKSKKRLGRTLGET